MLKWISLYSGLSIKLLKYLFGTLFIVNIDLESNVKFYGSYCFIQFIVLPHVTHDKVDHVKQSFNSLSSKLEPLRLKNWIVNRSKRCWDPMPINDDTSKTTKIGSQLKPNPIKMSISIKIGQFSIKIRLLWLKFVHFCL